MDGQKDTWTIGELAEHAAALLGPATQSNGRVRDVPNERLIRWYVTIGLLDPPLARRGRIALYGPRHLLQLVAIKRRQASGASIAEIQLELAGAPDTTLQSIAALPHSSPATIRIPYDPHHDESPPEPPDGPHPDQPHPDGPPRRADTRFWTSAAAAEVVTSIDQASPATRFHTPKDLTPPAPTPATLTTPARIWGVRLAPGVTLLLDDLNHLQDTDARTPTSTDTDAPTDAHAPTPTDADLAQIADAAAPLLLKLAELHLLPHKDRTRT